jgi:regulator of protease activity HflC (stomatin/prohibitin superfamily)
MLMTATDRRGEGVAVLCLLVSLAAALILAVLAIASESTSSAAWAAAFQMFGVVGIWVVTLIQLHQRRLVTEERLEIAELERHRREKLGGSQTIFDTDESDGIEKLAMGRRLRSIERFLVPAGAILTAAYHCVVGLSLFSWKWQFSPIADAGDAAIVEPTRLAVFCGAIAFVSFACSRYALGMSRLKEWGLMCAGGNFMFGSSAVCLAVCISLFCDGNGVTWVEPWVARGVGVLLIALAAETVLNFVLDFYRPRVPDLPQRPFYDSRLLGMFSEPGGILRSLANAIDYQFGFKVSETWFYKLLGRAVIPLLLVQIAVIVAVTCITVVPPGHQAVIERFGIALAETAKPGIHLTAPWPMDRATVIPVERIQRMELGHATDVDEGESGRFAGPVLWTRAHYKKEYKLLVADRAASADTKVPVNLLSVSMPLQWRVKSADDQVIRFYSQTADVAGIIESMAYRELTRYAAGADILDLLGAGGIEASAELQRRIQAACDQGGQDGRGLGVEIVHVGIGGVHPPSDGEVATSYEAVVGAIEQRDARIKKAQGEAAEIRVGSAGTGWDTLYQAILREDAARTSNSADLRQRTDEVEQLLRGEIGGFARQRVARAEMRTLARVFSEQSAAERYATQISTFRVAPKTYALRVYLRMLEEGLRSVRKYVIVLDQPDKVIYEMDLRQPQGIDVLGAELSAMEAKADEME